MELEKISKTLNKVMVWGGGLMLALILISFAGLDAKKLPPDKIKERLEMLMAKEQGITLNPNLPELWPPAMNEPYPDFEMIDQMGEVFMLSDLKGKVVIIETVDITSPISQARSGARQYGTFGSVAKDIDPHAMPIENLLKQTPERLSLPNPDIVILKLIFSNEAGKQAKAEDARLWAAHFQLKKEQNVIVAVPSSDFTGDQTNTLIPGFQLLDRDLNLRVDSAGPVPKHSLDMLLIPLVPKLL